MLRVSLSILKCASSSSLKIVRRSNLNLVVNDRPSLRVGLDSEFLSGVDVFLLRSPRLKVIKPL